MKPTIEQQAERSLHLADARDEALAAEYAGVRVTTPPEPAKAANDRARFAFVHISSYLGELTAPNWLIRDIVEVDSLLMIFGDPESGKSFMAMDWAASVASGRDWNGFPVKQGPVLYINGEGRNGINRRFTAWRIANQVNLDIFPLYFSTVTTALTDEISRAELEAVIAEFIRQHGTPVLIVIDTVARNYGPGDENSTQDMSRAIATCDSIRELTHAAVALVHHSGHADKNRGRGSMALRGALDAEFRMTRTESLDTTFECTKMKDAERPAPMSFRFAQVELGLKDDYGRDVTSAVLRKIDYVPPAQQGMPKPGRPAGGKHQATALDILWRLHTKAVARVIAQGRDGNEAKIDIESWRSACVDAGMSRQRFHEARGALIGAEKVRFERGFVTPTEEP